MKKMKVLFLCLMAVMLMACLAGCSSRRNNNTSPNSSSAAGSTTAGESGSGTAAQSTEGTSRNSTEDTMNNDEENENGAGSTGSTEGETGVLDGLLDDAERGVDDMMDETTNSNGY